MSLFYRYFGIKKEKAYLVQLAKIGITVKNEEGKYESEYFYLIPRKYVVVRKTIKADLYKDIKGNKKYRQISDKRVDTPGTVVIIDKQPIEIEKKRITYKDAQKIRKTGCYIYYKRGSKL